LQAGSRGITLVRGRWRRFSAFLEAPHHAFAKQRFRFAEESCLHVREDTVQIASYPQGHDGVRRQCQREAWTRNGSYRP